MPVIGVITYIRWKYKWLLNYSLIMAAIFLLINYFNPDTYNKALMPALQSVWFVPHVLVYIFSYALLAASSIVAYYGLYKYYNRTYTNDILDLANNLVYVGFGFLSLGLLFGALWAKEAWGHYWTWDPKETWAMLTWLGYLMYIHLRYRYPNKTKAILITLAAAFIILLLCWFGVNYMPSAAQSVHTYSNT
nr:cytochrome c biogenesis protein CcsA [Flavobacterium potami]